MQSNPTGMLLLYVVALVPFVQASCLHGTSQLVRRVTANNTVEVSKFGYTGKIGPNLWHTLSKENSLCASGAYQSPINLGELLFLSYYYDGHRQACILMSSLSSLTFV
jgi:carbonic anhydrase